MDATGEAPTDAADALHRLLADASPGDRAGHLLRLIEEAADACLRLPELAGTRLPLHQLRLDPDSLRGHAEEAATPSWRAAHGGAHLRGAVFRSANLQEADLSGADLTGADFTGSAMRSARLAGAVLEGAAFAGADLTGVVFEGVRASEADFSDALLEDATFKGAVLRFARMGGALLEQADFTGADLWGAKLAGAEAPYARLAGVVAEEADFTGTDLTGADFEGADLKKANLAQARLRGANLRNAALAGATLDGADLTDASLPRANLSTCSLRHVRLAGAWLESTRFRIEQLGGALGEEVAGDWAAARQGYLNLEQNFRSLGTPEAASWAYRRARRMGKRDARAAMVAAFRARHWRELPLRAAIFGADAFSEWLCDYGESLPRVLRAFVSVLLCFALFYGLTGSLLHEVPNAVPGATGTRLVPTHSVADLIGFSFLEMCTSSIPDLGLRPASRAVYFAGSLQYVMGVVLIGLFGYVLGNRIRR